MNATCRPEVVPIVETIQAVDKAGMVVGITFGVLLFITLVIAIAVVSSKAFCIKKYTSTEVEMINADDNEMPGSSKPTKGSKVVPLNFHDNSTIED